MLTRYSSVKKAIGSNLQEIEKMRTDIRECENTVRNLNTHLNSLIQSNQIEIEKECESMLNRGLKKIKDYYDEELGLVTAFREKELDKLNKLQFNLKQSCNVDSSDYNERFSSLTDTFKIVSDGVLRYMSESDLEAYRNVNYGIDLVNESPDKLKEYLDYFDNFRDYDMLVSGVCSVEDKVDNIRKEVLLCIVIASAVVIFAFKYLLVVPYILFIASTLFIRIRGYYNLVRLVDAYLLLESLKEDSLRYYHKQVDSVLFGEDEKLGKCKLHLEQICEQYRRNIMQVRDEKLEKHKREFNYERARQTAMASIENLTEHTENDLKAEEDKLKNLQEALNTLQDKRADLINELSRLKNEIKSIYEDLTPSFKEKILLSKFFLGFDRNDEPVSFNYNKKATLILYEGETEGQVDAVMNTLKMMCSQIMCSMYPLAYTICVSDTLTGGAPLSAFRSASEDVDTDSGSKLFKVVSTNRGVESHIDELYEIFEKRKLQVLGKYKDIDDYNTDKMKYNARTLPYLVSFFYHFDYKIFNTSEKLQQICRLSADLGIVPVFFVDISRIGNDIKGDNNSKKFDYKPEILENQVDLFTGNIFGFSIDESVEIIKFTNKEVIKTLNE